VRTRVPLTPLLRKCLRRCHHEVGAPNQRLLHGAQRVARHAGERRVLVDAVVDHTRLAKPAHEADSVREERPEDRPRQARAPSEVADRGGEQHGIQLVDAQHTGQRHRQRARHVQVGIDPHQSLNQLSTFGHQAARITARDGGPAHADGVHPQDAVLLRQDAHDVRLAGRIALPVVSEADDRLVANHFRSLRAAPATDAGACSPWRASQPLRRLALRRMSSAAIIASRCALSGGS
jgi:hypothetical protein